MNVIKRCGAGLLALLLCILTLAPATASAEEFTYTSVAGTSTTFNKYLTLDSGTNVPTAEFSFTIEPGTPSAATPGAVEVLAGPTAGTGDAAKPSIASVSFASSDDTTPGLPSDETGSITEDKKYATQTVTVDFTGVEFTEPGVYRYLITESETSLPGVTNDSNSTRTLDVYVSDTGTGLAVSQYVLHTNDAAPAANEETKGTADVTADGAALNDKSVGFTNEYTSYDLTISKTVSGNQASKDKYFKFTVTIEGAGANNALTVDWTNGANEPTARSATIYEAEDMAEANSADDDESLDGYQWVTDEDGAVTKTVYLQHGQSIVIHGIASGAAYTVVEIPEDYKSSAENDTIAGTLEADQEAAFTNTRSGTVPTGVMLTVVPGVVIVTIAVFGLLVLSRKRKNEA